MNEQVNETKEELADRLGVDPSGLVSLLEEATAKRPSDVAIRLINLPPGGHFSMTAIHKETYNQHQATLGRLSAPGLTGEYYLEVFDFPDLPEKYRVFFFSPVAASFEFTEIMKRFLC